MNYFDTSALIKRFVQEAGSDAVDALVAAQPSIATSIVAYAEVHAGLARKLRERAFSARVHRQTAQTFDADWRAFLRVAVTESLLDLTRGSSPLKNRRESENEDFGVRARRESGSKVVTFVEEFATQPWR